MTLLDPRKRTGLRLVVLASAFCLPLTLTAQVSPPPLVKAGLDSLSKGNCEGAIGAWTYTWTGAEDVAKRQQLLESCGQIRRVGGALQGYDVVRVITLGPNVIDMYFVARYETQPIFLFIRAYRPRERWKITGIFWNTDPTKLPSVARFVRDSVGP